MLILPLECSADFLLQIVTEQLAHQHDQQPPPTLKGSDSQASHDLHPPPAPTHTIPIPSFSQAQPQHHHHHQQQQQYAGLSALDATVAGRIQSAQARGELGPSGNSDVDIGIERFIATMDRKVKQASNNTHLHDDPFLCFELLTPLYRWAGIMLCRATYMIMPPMNKCQPSAFCVDKVLFWFFHDDVIALGGCRQHLLVRAWTRIGHSRLL